MALRQIGTSTKKYKKRLKASKSSQVLEHEEQARRILYISATWLPTESMGWFWGNSSSSEADPTKKLDPSLREYLEQESPSKYTPTAAGIRPQQQRQSQEKKPTETSGPQDRTAEAVSSVPSASLFPDGRYAHLWKDYKPLEEIEGPSVSPAERVVEQFKQRKEVLNKAALENCSEEHEDLSLCFKKGTFADKIKARLTMCGEQNARFSRCYTMQSVSIDGVISLREYCGC